MTLEDGEDAHIYDLISHRFLSEAVRARQQREQKRQDASRAQALKERERRLPTSIKSTKATQLRSIAMAERVDSTPFDLWQMPRFQKSANAYVDSRSGSKRHSESSGYQPTAFKSDVAGSHDGDVLKYTSDLEKAEEGYPPVDMSRDKDMADTSCYHKFQGDDEKLFQHTPVQDNLIKY